MKIDIKRNQRIKLILDLINKRRKINPEQEVFQFQYKELTKLKSLKDQFILNQILKKIQEESECIAVHFPETPEHLTGKPLIDEKSKTASIVQILYKDEGAVTLSKETIDSFSAIAIYVENFEKFDEYYKRIISGKNYSTNHIEINQDKTLISRNGATGDFYYKSKLIKFGSKETIYYLLFECLYENQDLEGFCSYEDIDRYLEQRDKKGLTDNKKIRARIKNGFVDLFRFSNLDNVTPDGKKLIRIIRGRGLILYNPLI